MKIGIIYTLAILSVVSIVFIVISINLCREQIFIEIETISIIDYFIIISFIFVSIFIAASLVWLFNTMRRHGGLMIGDSLLLLLGMLCLVMLFGDKVLVDEIGREMRLGWETTGELVILHILLIFQLFYALLVLRKARVIMRRSRRPEAN
jgi:hypothetical protein